MRAPLTLLACLLPLPAQAGQALFDGHLHYDAEHARLHDPAAILTILDAHGVSRALVTGRPPRQVLALHGLAPARILPLLGVYEEAGDKADWWRDTGLPARLEKQLSDGPWRGIGELHLFADARRSPVFLRIVELAVARQLPLLIHGDPAVIDALFAHAPAATVIWAHAGAYPYPDLLRDYLARYPGLQVDLSVRDARLAPGGELDSDWEWLLLEYSDRFMVGVDTYRVERWADYGDVAARIRGWLAQLPAPVAARIAHGNAERLFGPTP